MNPLRIIDQFSIGMLQGNEGNLFVHRASYDDAKREITDCLSGSNVSISVATESAIEVLNRLDIKDFKPKCNNEDFKIVPDEDYLLIQDSDLYLLIWLPTEEEATEKAKSCADCEEDKAEDK